MLRISNAEYCEYKFVVKIKNALSDFKVKPSYINIRSKLYK